MVADSQNAHALGIKMRLWDGNPSNSATILEEMMIMKSTATTLALLAVLAGAVAIPAEAANDAAKKEPAKTVAAPTKSAPSTQTTKTKSGMAKIRHRSNPLKVIKKSKQQ